ncbi:MAG: hypothetical protein ACQXXF_01510, partial [Thermoplasmatota archaeon]
TQTVQNIIIFRFGPDGNVETTKTSIEINDKSNVLEAIRNKCNELYENDEELQQALDEKEDFSIKIESRGYGFHFAFFRPMRQSKLMLRSVILYRYFNDEDYTKVNNQTIATGPHKGRILVFVGYICFSDRFFGYIVIKGYSVFRIDIKQTI